MQTTPPDSYDDPLPYGEHISFTEYAEASHNSFKRGDTLPDVPVPEMMAQAATSPEKPASRPRSPFIAAIVVALAFAVIVGSALTYYTTVSYPTELNAHATAVVRNVLKIQTQTALAATATTNALSPEELYSSITRRAPDILDSLNTSATSSWYNGQAPSGSGLCFFSGNSFHIKVERTLFSMTCYSQLGNDRNFVYQVQMTILRGGTGGLYFRGNPASYILGYVFLVDQEGNYALFIYHDRDQRILLATGFAASMARGLGQTNLISVMARGKILDLYVNRQLVISVADSTYNNGEFGLIGGQTSFSRGTSEVAFNDAQIWVM
ncbi:MAG TPA: hypothetical protein VFQ30_03255 [Ktedonobacteraceae bacterium]|nr:hypothetical protein [Ktedonobacteraceae bacterium]